MYWLRLSRTESRISRCFHRNLATKRQKRVATAFPKKPNEQTLILPPSLEQPKLIGLDTRKDDDFLLNHPEMYHPDIHMASAPTDWKGYEPATPLWEDMVALIGVTGKPLSMAEYMRMCLTHPLHGYYTKATTSKQQAKDDFDEQDDDFEDDDDVPTTIIGPQGDFITAPEISQIFGECLGVWFVTQWQQQGKPKEFAWLECGPGNASLMTDLLRFTFHPKLQDTFGTCCSTVHFVESSPVLRKVQQQNLQKDLAKIVRFDFGEGAPDNNLPLVKVHWHDSILSFRVWQKEHEKKLPLYVIGQEFIDALPVYAFEKTAEGWRERMVDVALREDMMEDEDRERWEAMTKGFGDKKPRLRVVLAPEVTPAAETLLQVNKETGLMKDEDVDSNIGSVVEVCPEGILFVKDIAKLIDEQGGAALIIDYGQEGTRDTIRGFSKHEQVHFLSRPGEVDITADVDFAALKHGVNTLGLKTLAFGPTGQGDFLVAMGAQDRVVQLIESENTTDQQAEDLYDALVRLASPEEMGERFKVLAISQKKDDIFEPPGFQ